MLATHEQVMGGDGGQVYMGCRFPADPAYAARLARHGQAIGERLAAHGVLGRVSIDFAAASDGGRCWHLHALEVNLRKGGTTHPYAVLRNLVPGRYDEGRAMGRPPTATARCVLVDRQPGRPGLAGPAARGRDRGRRWRPACSSITGPGPAWCCTCCRAWPSTAASVSPPSGEPPSRRPSSTTPPNPPWMVTLIFTSAAKTADSRPLRGLPSN